MPRISIVSIPVTDQEKSKQFYSTILGLGVVRDTRMGSQRWVQLAPSEGTATITLVTWFETMPAGCLKGLVLETSNLREDHAAFKRRGLALSAIESAPWGRYATFEDPDGNGWVLQETSANT